MDNERNKRETEEVIKAAKVMLDRLMEYPVFCGHFDAKHSREGFISGIVSVMEYIAALAGEDEYKRFEEIFSYNYNQSIKEANKKE